MASAASPVTARVAKLRSMFSEMQDKSDTSAAQWISRLHKAYEWFESRGHYDAFFNAFVRNMCVALIAKERNEYVQRILELVASFAASFVVKKKKEKQEDEAKKDEVDVEAPHPFFAGLLEWLLDHHEARSNQARLSICHLINRLLMELGEEACLDDELYVKIHDAMLVRIKDRVADIRCQAVLALTRLQDPRDKDCPVLKAFLFHMSKDSSASVRQSILRSIGASKLTLPHILHRLADIDEKARKTAFTFFAEKVHIKSLTIAQREHILRRGFDDRSDAVNSVVQREIVPAWLRLCNGNIVELLYALDVGSASDKKIAGKVLSVLFKGVPYKELLESFHFLDNHKLIPFSKLTSETAIYWKSLAFFLQYENNAEANECLDQLFPELTTFCRYVQHFMLELDHSRVGNESEEEEESDDVTWRFVSKQLIDMIALFDLADEVGRTNLGLLCRTLLASPRITAEFVEPLVVIFANIRVNIHQRVSDMAEIISDLREPLREQVAELIEKQQQQQPNEGSKAQMEQREEEERAKKVAVAKVRVAIDEKDNELQQAVGRKDFAAAQTLQLELESLKLELEAKQSELEQFVVAPLREETENAISSQQETQPSTKPIDPEIALKCLRIIYYTMQDPKIKALDPTLVTLVEEFILPTFGNVSASVRNAAVDALVVCSLRNIELAKRQLFLLLQVAYLDDVEVRLTALAGVNDLLMWHGLPAFMSPDESTGDYNGGENDRSDPSPQVHPLTQTDLNRDGGESVVALFVDLLSSEEEDVVAKVAECLCKLLMIGAITSPKLLQRLMLLWYNPVMENNNRLRHILGTFFPLYASLKRSHQDSLEEALLPTLKTIAMAPMSSPLSQINKDDVAAFFLHLTREDFLQAKECEGINLHDGIAFAIINEIIAHPDNGINKCLCKALGNLQLTPDDSVKLRELHQHYEEMRSQLRDPLLRRTLVKFGNNLAAWLASAPQTSQNSNNEDVHSDNALTTSKNNDNNDEEQPADQITSSSNSSVNSNKKKTLFTNSQDSSLLNPSEEIESVSSPILGSNIIKNKNVTISKKHDKQSEEAQRTQVQETDEEEEDEDDPEAIANDNNTDGDDNDKNVEESLNEGQGNHKETVKSDKEGSKSTVVSPLKALSKGGKNGKKKARLEVDSNSSSVASSDTDSIGSRSTRTSTRNVLKAKSFAERQVGDRSRKVRRILSSTDSDEKDAHEPQLGDESEKDKESKTSKKINKRRIEKSDHHKKNGKTESKKSVSKKGPSESPSSLSKRVPRRLKSAVNLSTKGDKETPETEAKQTKRRSNRLSRKSK